VFARRAEDGSGGPDNTNIVRIKIATSNLVVAFNPVLALLKTAAALIAVIYSHDG
jgi:hypothetical protein